MNNEVLEKLLNDKVGTTLIKDFAKEKISFDLAKSFYEIDKKDYYKQIEKKGYLVKVTFFDFDKLPDYIKNKYVESANKFIEIVVENKCNYENIVNLKNKKENEKNKKEQTKSKENALSLQK